MRKSIMEKKIIYDALKSCYKIDIKDLGSKIGLDKLSRLSFDELIELIVKKNGFDNLNLVLENINKNGLECINKHFLLIYSNKRKEELILQVKNYINQTFNQNVQNEEKIKEFETKNKSTESIIFNKKDLSYKNDFKIEEIKDNKSNLLTISYYEKIKKIISDLVIPIQFIQSTAREQLVQSFIVEELKKKDYQPQNNCPIGGYFNLLIDIDLDKGEFGIEIKIWSHLKKDTKEISRAIGQAYIYSNEKYRFGNYMFLVFCKVDEKDDPKLNDLEDIIKKLNGTFLKRVV
jgi:hypothetical protein